MRSLSTVHQPTGITVHQRKCADWSDLLVSAQRVLSGAQNGAFQSLPCASLSNQDLSWHGGVTLAQAIELGWQGWPEGKKRLQDLQEQVESLRLMPQAWRAIPTWDVAGEEPDVGRFLEGLPENMMTLVPRTQPYGKVIRLLVESACCWTIPASQILLRGAALLTAICKAKMLGYTIDLALIFNISSNYSKVAMETTIPILLAGEILDIDRLAFMLLHPCVLRRLMLAMNECEPVDIRRAFGFHYPNGGYGRVTDFPLLPPIHDFYLGNSDASFPSSKEEAATLAKKILANCGISLDEDELSRTP